MAEHVCPWWQAYTFDHRGRRLIHKPERVVGPYVKPGATVMDVGCGMGFFSIAMAGMVGDDGVVLAVDLQQKMLDVLMKRARRAGVAARIRAHCCGAQSIGVDEPVDFVLACYVLHEAPDQKALLTQVRACLKPQAKFLILEPRWHVRKRDFEHTIELAAAAGMRVAASPSTWMDRAALLEPV